MKETLIKKKLIDIFEKNGIPIYSEYANLELDSIEHIMIMIAIEQEFNISFPDYLLIHSPKAFNDFTIILTKLLKS